MTLWRALAIVETIACLLAWLLVRRTLAYRTLAYLATYAILNHLGIEAIRAHLEAYPAHPWTGRERALYHLATGLSLGWSAVLAWGSWRAFAPPAQYRRGSRSALVSWSFAAAFMAVSYPLPRGATAVILHMWVGCGVVVSGVAVAVAWGRAWGNVHAAIVLLIATECAVATIGPFVRDPYKDWPLAQVGYLMGFSSVSLACAWWLYREGARWKRGS